MLFDRLAEELLELKLAKIRMSMPVEIFETYTEFSVKSIGVYRELATLSTEERVLYDRYIPQAKTDDECEKLRSIFTGVCFSATDGWSFLMRPESIIKANGFNEGEVVFLRPIEFEGRGVGFTELSEQQVSALQGIIGNTFTYEGLDAMKLVDEIYFRDVKVDTTGQEHKFS